MLEVHSLAFEYGDKPLFKRIEFKVNKGQFCQIRGRNGVGKSTLLRLIAGLFTPLRGQIHYDGQNIFANIFAYQQKICYLGHKIGISPFLTVEENCNLNWFHRKKSLNSFEFFLKKFGLESVANKLCAHLSLGQKQRVGLLRLAMTEAPLWLLDEPFAALDQEAIALLMELFEDHLKREGQILLISHQEFILNWKNSFYYDLSPS